MPCSQTTSAAVAICAKWKYCSRVRIYNIIIIPIAQHLQKSKSFGPKNLTTSLLLSSLNIFFFALTGSIKLSVGPSTMGFWLSRILFFSTRKKPRTSLKSYTANRINTTCNAKYRIRQEFGWRISFHSLVIYQHQFRYMAFFSKFFFFVVDYFTKDFSLIFRNRNHMLKITILTIIRQMLDNRKTKQVWIIYINMSFH